MYTNQEMFPGSGSPSAIEALNQLPSVRVAGVPLIAADAHEVLDCLSAAAMEMNGVGLAVHFVNAFTVSLTAKEEYLQVFNDDALNFADGTPLAWFAQRTGRKVAHVRGPDAFRRMLASDPSRGLRHFLLGGTEETLARLTTTIAREYPSASVVGACSPPFRPLVADDLKQIDEQIARSGANVIWVGIGTPKQDYEVARLARNHPAVVLAVGAAFNFVSGDVIEAPARWRRTGMEWLYRLMREPRRLWRRYLIGNIQFIFFAITRRGN